MRPRVIPALLLKNKGLVKTVKFKNPTYVGDFINAVKIFNDKEVDELLFLDITATLDRRPPPIDLIAKITEECFMPLGYGGGIRSVDEVRKILRIGVEKVAINSYAVENPDFVQAAAALAGSQSIVVSMDVKRNMLGKYRIYTHSGTKKTGLDPVEFAIKMEQSGAGEIFINSIDRDGTMTGFDLELIRSITREVTIPVVACGGANGLQDFVDAVKIGGASAVAAGSLFVFKGRHRAVLINYPTSQELNDAFENL